MSLSPEQNKIIELPGNIVVSAGAGSGKTRVLVEKIKYDLANNKSHKTIAGITFTIKAANEIKERLVFEEFNGFVGTNNSFVLSEIIKPFIADALGEDYRLDYDTAYTVKKNTYEDCLAYAKSNKAICVFADSKQNFMFQLAYNILVNSAAARNYLVAKYFRLYIDEYQDTDTDMHQLFMYLCEELDIALFVVGDDKQSIYGWRGADTKLFLSLLDKENFTHKCLLSNHRCCQAVQNVSNLLFEKTQSNYVQLDVVEDVVMYYDVAEDKKKEIIDSIIKETPRKHYAVLRRQRKMIPSYLDYLNKQGHDFVFIPATPLDDVVNKNEWFYRSITEYCLINPNIYLFINNLPAEGFEERKEDVAFYKLIEDGLMKIKNWLTNKTSFIEEVNKFAGKIGVTADNDSIEKMFLTASNVEYRPAFEYNDSKNQIMTIHSSKGKEFDTVFLFDEDFNPSTKEEKNALYVAMTRAKEKLYIFSSNIASSKLVEEFSKLTKDVNRKGKDYFNFIKL